MDTYYLLRLIHIISATVLFGTGLGIAFFLFMAKRSGNSQAIRITAQHVVLADWIFTAPAVVVQAVSGYLLMQHLGYSFISLWFYTVVALFILVGLCWLPVVYIQIKIRDITKNHTANVTLFPPFQRLMALWTLLGIPAFTSVLILFALMVYKPWL